jgi:hypothetical protein
MTALEPAWSKCSADTRRVGSGTPRKRLRRSTERSRRALPVPHRHPGKPSPMLRLVVLHRVSSRPVSILVEGLRGSGLRHSIGSGASRVGLPPIEGAPPYKPARSPASPARPTTNRRGPHRNCRHGTLPALARRTSRDLRASRPRDETVVRSRLVGGTSLATARRRRIRFWIYRVSRIIHSHKGYLTTATTQNKVSRPRKRAEPSRAIAMR